MEEWKTYRLGDIITISSGFPYKGEFIGKGDNFLLGMGCVSFKETFLNSGLRPYSGDAPERYVAYPGDIVLATRQQSDNLPILGMPAIIPQAYNGYKMIIGANLYKVQNESEFSNAYIYWLMKSPAYLHHIKSCQTGTTVRMITKANIEDFTFKAPGKSERDKIASFLWNIEEKIAINRQINDNLEQQAQALYKSWFIDNYQTEWPEYSLDEVTLKITDGVHNTVIDTPNGEYYLLSCKNIKNRRLNMSSSDRRIDEGTFNKLRKRTMLSKGDILLSSVGTIGELMLLNDDPHNYEFQRSVAIIKPNPVYISSYYLYETLISQIDKITNTAHGAVQQCIFLSDLKEYTINIADKALIRRYDIIVKPFFDEITKREKEIARLTSLRDSLLPKLMSGELKINEIDC